MTLRWKETWSIKLRFHLSKQHCSKNRRGHHKSNGELSSNDSIKIKGSQSKLHSNNRWRNSHAFIYCTRMQSRFIFQILGFVQPAKTPSQNMALDDFGFAVAESKCLRTQIWPAGPSALTEILRKRRSSGRNGPTATPWLLSEKPHLSTTIKVSCSFGTSRLMKYFSITRNHGSEKNDSKCDWKGNNLHVLLWDSYANCWKNSIESGTGCRVKSRRADKMIFAKKLPLSSTVACRVYGISVFQSKSVRVTFGKILQTTMLQSEQEDRSAYYSFPKGKVHQRGPW